MNMKVILAIVIAVILALVAAWAIDVDVDGGVELPEITTNMDVEGGELPNVEITGEFELPSVDMDVDAEGGNLPEVDINTVDIDIETETKTFEVPTGINVDKPEENTVAEEDDL